MFRYGTKNGVLAIVLLLLAVVPMLAAVAYLPQLPAEVPMKFDAAGAVVRLGSKYEVLIGPSLALAMGLGAYFSAGRQAIRYGKDDPMAGITYGRFLRNGVVAGIVLDVASFYILYTVVMGHGIGF